MLCHVWAFLKPHRKYWEIRRLNQQCRTTRSDRMKKGMQCFLMIFIFHITPLWFPWSWILLYQWYYRPGFFVPAFESLYCHHVTPVVQLFKIITLLFFKHSKVAKNQIDISITIHTIKFLSQVKLHKQKIEGVSKFSNSKKQLGSIPIISVKD